MKLEWSAEALADLDRFAEFLHERHPRLAAIVAREIVEKTRVLESNPEMGSPIDEAGLFRQLVLEVLNARYVFRYRISSERIVMLRVYHGRESR